MPQYPTSEKLGLWSVSPEKVLRGDALVKEASDLFNMYRAKYGLEVIAEATAFVECLALAEPGTPVVRLRPSRNHSRPHELDMGGKLAAPVVLEQQPRGPWLMAAVDSLGYDHKSITRKMFLSPEGILQGFANGGRSIAVGEQAVRQLLQRDGLYCLGGNSPTNTMLMADGKWLDDMSHTGLPLEFLGLSDSERATVCDYLTTAILTSKNDTLQAVSYRALQFVASPETDAQKDDLRNALNGQLASMLPITPGDNEGAIYISFGLSEHQPIPQVLCEKLPDGSYRPPAKKPSLETLRATYLAHLYTVRATQIEQRGRIGVEEKVIIPDWPQQQKAQVERRQLHTFINPYPNSGLVRHDADYLLELRAAGVPSKTAVERDFESMRQARVAMLKLLSRTESLQERVNIFCALEYLFEVERVEQRDYFYELMCLQHSYNMPVDRFTNLSGQTNVAEAMAAVMPHPPLGRQASRAANTAALMADFYKHRASQLLRRDLRRYRPLAPREESST